MNTKNSTDPFARKDRLLREHVHDPYKATNREA